ncbi:TonB-dependent receptor [Parabacteroides gordonii]|uniref:TonB-dependent receptor n=1 Tax=Parabacteroides gordonii MS-1 = DSM 23371 TaxID=1203610 RepID=A0A0F5JHS3_9BACT|nr:TonB-dependent receptor [Parabacteroides gordonii]KKB57361.1 hypothetical protein HMPREF1536_02083 [Parabacteroides gordonii MS-1 = DSM 23371]MCA5582549.1 TonB-dependent receptor [Parabacteroides gordonii]
MRIGIIPGMLAVCHVCTLHAQDPDSLRNVSLSEIVVTENFQYLRNKNTTLHLDVVGKEFLKEHFSGNLMQTLEQLPGVHSMDIGSGFSKPVIRGMGFNRVSVTENGIKQEGQQWGADHGLEIDAFNVEQVNIRKGPASLLYGSDAMGGVVEITQAAPPFDDQVFGEVDLLGKSVNGLFGGSLMLGVKKDRWYTKLRYSEQHFGDYRIPTDTISYLTQKIPVYNRRLKNTAGFERDASLFTQYRKGRYMGNYAVSNAYQKVGFFPGAHGIPDPSRVQDDGSSRNIELPYSFVNHLKATTHQEYAWEKLLLQWDLGYQNNHREEWSQFHTHYGTQPVPDKDPDKELAFTLNTFSSGVKVRFTGSQVWDHSAGWDLQYQRNTISGYSFLLPEYTRFTTGLSWLTTYKPTDVFSVSGGLRYDIGKTDISPFTDAYLATYLQEQGYSQEVIEMNKIRSHAVDRSFGDYSGSLGIVWSPAKEHLLKVNVGHSFRLPGANELASNGVHHGTFRHEQGDPDLDSERGWQLDMAYSFFGKFFSVTISPFASWFSNYIYLKPTGEWSVLPHAGQIYRYTGAEALFAGGEISAKVYLPLHFTYELGGEYVYTYNCDEHIPLSFSPPGSLRNTLSWEKKRLRFYAEHQYIADQNRVARNEDPTPGAQLLHLGAGFRIPVGSTDVEVTLSARNLLNTKYYNHLSFYRKVEIPEPGRNFQILIKIPFKKLLK